MDRTFNFSLILSACAALFTPVAFALSDSELFQNGKQHYQNGEYLDASLDLYAYRERSPSALNDATFRNELDGALAYSVDRVRDQAREIATLREKVQQLETGGLGSSVQGLGLQPPTLGSPPLATLRVQVPPREHAAASAMSAQQICSTPSTPELVAPEHGAEQPNHYYGQGEAWKFSWSSATCGSRAVTQYRIVIKAKGAVNAAVDQIASSPSYVGNLTGTISAIDWTFKVRAIGPNDTKSAWTEERPFTVRPWD